MEETKLKTLCSNSNSAYTYMSTKKMYSTRQARSTYFSKVKKGTKPRGELIIIDFFKHEVPVGPPTEHKISWSTVMSELNEAGYKIFEINVELLPYQYIIKAK